MTAICEMTLAPERMMRGCESTRELSMALLTFFLVSGRSMSHRYTLLDLRRMELTSRVLADCLMNSFSFSLMSRPAHDRKN